MQEQFVIEGGARLEGEITVSGNKNAALKMLPACLLTSDPVILKNVPRIRDVQNMCTLMQGLGAQIDWLDDQTVRVEVKEITTHVADPHYARQIRPGIVLAGPMLARCGRFELPPPGGDVIGRRRLDTHILALEALGAKIDFDGKFFMQTDGLKGANILLDEASVTATENAIMAAVMAKGTTLLRNAASEPHVQDLCLMLSSMGAKISGIGSNQLLIEGVERLGGCTARVGADYMEVGSYIGAAAVTNGEVRIREADPQHLDMMALVFRKLGVEWEVEGSDIFVRRGQTLAIQRDLGNAIPEIKCQPWPAFPADMMSIALTVATQCAGTVLFHDWMFDGRLFFTDRLVNMGARIVLCDPHRAMVQGPSLLRSDLVISSPDIRAGMALVIAALAAKGTTVIRNIQQIDRGYVNVEGKLQALGAKIRREGIAS
ncbi:MAG: UDP-N-acetylglucosamine 1-carboxyvinyltransferase [Anaerolineae bacterium]|nr:UDP-N-acetylglucosamine 1-carboxyvinyltransferase [Anaerolineae bacterium]